MNHAEPVASKMKLTLTIDDRIAASLKSGDLPLEVSLRIDLAVYYYEQGILSPGRAADLADLPRPEFEDFLKSRKSVRHYTTEDLKHELNAKR